VDDLPLISVVTFLPLAGALLLLGVSRERVGVIKHLALAVSLVTFLVSLLLYQGFQLAQPGMQFAEQRAWVPGFGIQYYVGVDGISLLLVLLTTFLSAVAILSSYSAITTAVKEYMICMLLLETGMLGVFVALDLVLFYIFWEGMLIPMYFLIGVWGGPRRIYATIKFFLYTMAGGVLMLLGIISLYYLNGARPGGEYTFDLLKLYGLSLPLTTQLWLFLAFAVAFAIKVPVFPLHTWLPDAHVEAPAAGSVILAGVLLKMGCYGFLRFNLPLFPQATVFFAPLMAVLAVIGILYGAAVAYSQKNLKKLIAYSSVSHLGFVMLGAFALTSQSVSGAILQMVNHGLSTGALFLIAGMIFERRHTYDFAQLGGLWKVVPVMGALALVVTLSSAGLPGLNGFVGEFTILSGSFLPSNALGSSWYAGVAALGAILAAVYLLVMYEKVFLGPVTVAENQHLADLNWREILILAVILVVAFWIGLYPKFFFDLMTPTVDNLVKVVRTAAGLP